MFFYEVTQLIYSTLGLLVFPEQQFYDKIPETKLSDLEKEGWPIPRVHGRYPQVDNLNKLARYLRNGISHFNLRFTETGGHVHGIIIWNNGPKKNEKTGRLSLRYPNLKRLLKIYGAASEMKGKKIAKSSPDGPRRMSWRLVIPPLKADKPPGSES